MKVLLILMNAQFKDLLDADRHYKDNDASPTNDGQRAMDGYQETKDSPIIHVSQNL